MGYIEVCDVCSDRMADKDIAEISIRVEGTTHTSSLCLRCQKRTSVFAAREALRTGVLPVDELWRRVEKKRIPRKKPKKARRR